MEEFKFSKILLGFSMLLMGICGICYEYVLGALGNYLMGSSHEQIYLIIGLMMFSMGLGAVLQKLFEKNLLEVFLSMEILLGLIGGVSCSFVYLAHGFTRVHQPILWGFAFAIGVIIGLEIPLLIRVNKRYSSSLKDNLSLILSLDYVGSLIGALLFTYLLLKYFSLTRISLFLGSINVLIGLVSLAYFRKEVPHPKIIFSGGMLVLLSLGTLFAYSPLINRTVEQQYYRDPIIASITTTYQHITLTQYQDQLNLYINGHLQFSSTDEHIYHEFLVHPAMMAATKPKHILILGGGDGLGLREVLKYNSVTAVELVDIDPAITQLCSTHPLISKLNKNAFANAIVSVHTHPATKPLQQKKEVETLNQNSLNPWDLEKFPVDKKVTLFHLDADLFLNEIKQTKYDVIILDFPDPQSIETAKLFSVEFYQSVRSLLNYNGIVVVQSGSPYQTKKAFACIGKSLTTAGFHAIPFHTYVPSLGDWGYHLAFDAKRNRQEVLQKLFNNPLEVSTQHLSLTTLKAGFCFGKNILLDLKEVRANTKLEVVLPEYYREGLR